MCIVVAAITSFNPIEMLLLLLFLFAQRRMNYYLLRKCLAGPLTRMHRSDRTRKLLPRSEPTHHVHLILKHAMAKRTLAHRIQYVEWNPTAISSIAVSPDNKYLACGRNNGRVEIWNIDNDFHMERVIPGRKAP